MRPGIKATVFTGVLMENTLDPAPRRYQEFPVTLSCKGVKATAAWGPHFDVNLDVGYPPATPIPVVVFPAGTHGFKVYAPGPPAPHRKRAGCKADGKVRSKTVA